MNIEELRQGNRMQDIICQCNQILSNINGNKNLILKFEGCSNMACPEWLLSAIEQTVEFKKKKVEESFEKL